MSIDESFEPATGDLPVNEPEIIQKRSRKRNKTVFIIVCLLNVGLLILIWTQLLTPRATHSPDDPSLAGEVSTPLIGKSAPDFTLPIFNENGKQLHLADFKGKPVILNFWGSWCEPCQQEAPFLQQTWTHIQSQGAVMIGVDIPESSDSAPLGFIRQYHITYTNVKDTIQGSIGLDYGTTGQPETFFINRDGIIVAHWDGALTQDAMQKELAKLQVMLK